MAKKTLQSDELNPHAKSAIVSKLLKIAAKGATLKGELSSLPLERRPVEGIDLEAIYFRPESYEEFGEVVNALLHKHGWSSKYSEKYLSEIIAGVLHDNGKIQSTEEVKKNFENAITDYVKFTEEHLAIYPLEGFTIAIPRLQLGRIRIKQYEGKTYAKLVTRIRRHILGNTVYTMEQKKKFADSYVEHRLKKLFGKACAEIDVIGDAEKAGQLALDEVRAALDLIRYSALFLSPGSASQKDRGHRVGVVGDVNVSGRSSLLISADGQSVRYSGSMTYRPFVISAHYERFMKDLGVFKLSELIRKPLRTDFEELLLRVVRWLASAQIQADQENAFLNLVTALETIFKPQPGEAITSTISEGVAILVGKNFDQRKEIKKQIVAFYRQRSTLTHEGHSSISESDLTNLISMVREVMMILVKHASSFSTHGEFRDWIEKQKLGVRVNFPRRKGST